MAATPPSRQPKPLIPPPPQLPLDPMEFLSRSWSVSALEISKALAPRRPPRGTATPVPEATVIDEGLTSNSFSFASSVTSQLVIDRIMSNSQEASPRTSGRLSHSSAQGSDSPPVSPSGADEVKYCHSGNTAPMPPAHRGGSRTVGRWLKDRRERKKEETRAHNAQLHAAISVAGVAAAVAAIAAATAAASVPRKDDRAARTEMAVASASTLVAAQCVEAAEALGAEREHLAAVVGSAVSVRTAGDIITLTAAAATALRGAATLKARVLKDAWNLAAVIPVEKNSGGEHHGRCGQEDQLVSLELLARGAELLKRTRKGALHRKMVSVYVNRMGQVMLKMKSKHVAGTITKKKKSVVIDVCRNVAAWPGRRPTEGGEKRFYFGLMTAEQRVIEFECRNCREYEMWTEGVSQLLLGDIRTPLT